MRRRLMAVKVKFVNFSRESILIKPIPGRNFEIKLVAGKTFARDPKIGTIEAIPMGGMPGAVHRPEVKWIMKPSDITWEDCPEDCDFAPFRTVSFHDDNIVKLRKRPFWKLPELGWPVVEFYFESKQYRTHGFQLDNPTTIFNMIPARRVVPPCSKYAPFRKWIFDEVATSARLVDPLTNRAMTSFQIGSGHGEDRRTGNDLAKIEEITERDKRERLAQII